MLGLYHTIFVQIAANLFDLHHTYTHIQTHASNWTKMHVPLQNPIFPFFYNFLSHAHAQWVQQNPRKHHHHTDNRENEQMVWENQRERQKDGKRKVDAMRRSISMKEFFFWHSYKQRPYKLIIPTRVFLKQSNTSTTALLYQTISTPMEKELINSKPTNWAKDNRKVLLLKKTKWWWSRTVMPVLE